MDRSDMAWKNGLYLAAVLTIGVAQAKAEVMADRRLERAETRALFHWLGELRGGIGVETTATNPVDRRSDALAR